MADSCSCASCKSSSLFSGLMPRGVHLVCGLPVVTRQRQKIVPLAEGDVVEIGFGSGLNLPHYDRKAVRSLVGVNPDDGLPDLARKAIARQDLHTELLVESAEKMSLPSQSADTVVVTYSLCSIPDVSATLAEMHRILRPGGRLLFCEHGRSPKRDVAFLQDALNAPWRAVAAGCHLNRETGSLIEASGFALEQYSIYDLGFGTRILGTHHLGIARKG
ncbi:class I SAM-dependent methyltransferase [uncultured Cohaesibacter sp.]|uniref:class I SAM-dependent methyltransferase n=1 Tax=uncultured Cohaesibacter sp. TaxID=1002546 RepID=UPI00292CAD19|nr:class I SAM-dependent methyltransferase [uncultured Cohaesibacter sp.]